MEYSNSKKSHFKFAKQLLLKLYIAVFLSISSSQVLAETWVIVGNDIDTLLKQFTSTYITDVCNNAADSQIQFAQQLNPQYIWLLQSTSIIYNDAAVPAPYCKYTYDRTTINTGQKVTLAGYLGIRLLCEADEFYNEATQQCELSTIEHEPVIDTNCNRGNPCNVATGDKNESKTDYEDGWLSFTRQYHSIVHTHDSNMGIGWTHNFSDYIAFDTNSNLLGWIRGDGYHEPMAEDGNNPGEYVTNSGSKLDSQIISHANGTYTLRRGSSRDTFDAAGQLIQRTMDGGQTLTLNYASGQLQSVSDEVGRSLTLGYDANGKLDKVTRPDGLDITYQYDANDNLQFVNYPDGTSIQYHYEDTNFPNHLTGITDERGNRSTYTYHPATGKVHVSTPVGSVKPLTFEYNTNPSSFNQTTVTDASGDETEYNFVAGNRHIQSIVEVCTAGDTRCTGDSTTTNTWDVDKLQSMDDNGLITQYGEHDELGRHGFMIKASGTPDARRTDYVYDSRFTDKVTQRIEHSVVNSNSTTTGNDLSVECIPATDYCKVTDSVYDNDGNLTSKIISGYKPDGTAISRTTTWQYNGPYGQLSQIDGPRTDVTDITTLEYYLDSLSEGNNRGRLKKVILANGIVQRDNIQYSVTGKILSEDRPNGLSLIYTYYSGNDRLETLTRTNGVESQVTRFTYEPSGEVKTITQASGSADASTTTFDYYASRLLWKITDDLGNYIEYGYDSEGNQTSEDVYDTTSTLKRSLSKTYDRFNRLDITQRNFNSDDSDFDVDGTLDKFEDGRGTVTDYSYDALRRMTQTIQDMGNLDITTEYVYDVADRLVKVKDPENLETVYEYDDLGNLLSQNSPDTGLTTYTYDDAGNRISQTDANGVYITYAYDELNRLTNIDYPNDTDIVYIYDDNNNGENGVSRLTSVTDGSGSVGNSYDYRGNLTNQERTQDGLIFTTSYEYNLRDELKKITYPSGREVDYARNSIGQITSVSTTSNGQTDTLVSSTSYLPFGPMDSLTYGNGLVETKTYDADYRLTDHITGTLRDISYQYDGSNNIKYIIDNTAPSGILDRALTYDPLNRLDFYNYVGNSKSYDYEYDNVGNRTSKSGLGALTTYGYDANSHHLTSITDSNLTTLSYDAVGNMTDDGSNIVTYNDFNQIGTINDDTNTLGSYKYNSNNQRAKKTNNLNIVTYYEYDIFGNLISEIDATATTQKEYVYLESETIAVLVEENIIQGTAGWDRLFGTDGRDIMYGGEGNDSLYGYGGNDLLIAGPSSNIQERNRLVGNDGHDVFHLELDWGLALIYNTDTGFQNNIEHIDSLRFGSGILPSDILLEAMPNGRGYTKGLHLTHTPTGNKAIIYGHHNGGDAYRMDQVIFMEDGTVWTDDDMDVMLGLAAIQHIDNSSQFASRLPNKGWAFGKPYYAHKSSWRDRHKDISQLEAKSPLVASQGGAE